MLFQLQCVESEFSSMEKYLQSNDPTLLIEESRFMLHGSIKNVRNYDIYVNNQRINAVNNTKFGAIIIENKFKIYRHT